MSMPAISDRRWTLEEVEELIERREGCAVEMWRPGDDRAVLTDDRLTWEPRGAPAPFQLDVASFFDAVADEA
jgi:hypothetical protein